MHEEDTDCHFCTAGKGKNMLDLPSDLGKYPGRDLFFFPGRNETPLTPYASVQILDASLFSSLAALDHVHAWSLGGHLENVEE
ncbi:hypothetical protein KI387_027138, partial [Taxus chinensis]